MPGRPNRNGASLPTDRLMPRPAIMPIIVGPERALRVSTPSRKAPTVGPEA
jgi:hypothetical protein